MIRIDFKRDGRGHVQTTWVREDGEKHSMMGRLLFDEGDFDKFQNLIRDSNVCFPDDFTYKFEEKKNEADA